MDELINLDSTFSPATFITKVNNIYVMLCTSMMTNNLKRVAHFLGEDLYQKKQKELDELNNKGIIQMYDELNVKNTFISDVQILDDKYVIKVTLVSRYLDYRLDKITKKFVNGNQNTRVEKDNILIFTKKRTVKKLGEVRTCPSCGSVMDINNNGVCKYCGKPFYQSDYDWILVEMY